jgi:hypothetical protein
MKIQTKQLKAFNSAASGMKQNGILPILSYLKLDNGTITKNNLESFITMEIDFEDSCLIDERTLMDFVESVNADEIDVEVKGTTVVLSHGKERVISPTDDVANFPAVSEPDGAEEIVLLPEVLKAIKIASNFTMDRENLPFTSCVFVGNGLVGATTGFIAYTEKIQEDLPKIILEKSMVSALKGIEFVTLSQNETYIFLSTGSFRYGFIKKDTKFIDMERFAAFPEGEAITMPKDDFIRFCDFCTSRCMGKLVVIASIKEDKLSMVDADYGIDYEKPLPVTLPDFSFNPSMMGKLLKSLPDDKLKFLKADKKMYITGENGGYVSVIMEMFVNQN